MASTSEELATQGQYLQEVMSFFHISDRRSVPGSSVKVVQKKPAAIAQAKPKKKPAPKPQPKGLQMEGMESEDSGEFERF